MVKTELTDNTEKPDLPKAELKNNTKKEIIKDSFIAALGLAVYGFGVYLTIQANIGCAPWDVLNLGLSNTFGCLYGTASIGVSVILVIVDLIMGEKIGIGTLIDAFLVGKTVDFLNWLDIIPEQTNIWISIPMMLIGFLICGFSQYLYMNAALCAGPRDSFQLAIGRRMPKVKIGVINIFILAAALSIGWILGGPVGIGTLLAPVGIGLFQQLSFNIMHFEPKNVVHQDIIQSFNVFRK